MNKTDLVKYILKIAKDQLVDSIYSCPDHMVKAHLNNAKRDLHILNQAKNILSGHSASRLVDALREAQVRHDHFERRHNSILDNQLPMVAEEDNSYRTTPKKYTEDI